MQFKKNLSRGILVDSEDEHLLHMHLFCVDARGYAISIIDGKKQYLHKLIIPSTGIVDHKDRNKLNNSRVNLREATRSQNNSNIPLPSHNTSGYMGVSKHGNYWLATIKAEGKKLCLGYHATKEAAALAYNAAALKYRGEFASLNIV